MEFPMGADENLVKELELRTSLLFPWGKATFALTNKRLEGRIPKTLFGVPTGSTQLTQPLKNVSNVGAETKFSILRLLVGLVVLGAGFGIIGDNAVVGILLIAFGLLVLAGVVQAAFVVSDNSGGSQEARVSVLEKKALVGFVGEVNRTIADVM